MLLSPIVLRIRSADTMFGNKIGGAADIAHVFEMTIQPNQAFVMQTSEVTEKNQYDTGINQRLSEQFSVVVALANDTTQADKTGLTAFDTLYLARSQLFNAVLGWVMDNAETPICYRGGKLLGFDRAYLWYQFIFEVDYRLTSDDGVDADTVANFDTIYAQYIMAPSVNLPYGGGLPASDSIVNEESNINLNVDPNAGAFSSAYSNAFDVYTGD